MTIIEKILLAAHTLETNGKTPFTAEELIVKAWETDKALFGLQGYADKHPDSNRVLTNIMGNKGLKGKGWIERVGEKQYRLTASGTRIALELTGQETEMSTRAGILERKQILILQRLLNSPALKKKMQTEEENIIFRDACNFWGISAYSDVATVKNRFTEIRDVLDDLEKAIAGSDIGVVALPEMKIRIDQEVSKCLRETHDLLQKKFFNELDAMRKRETKNKDDYEF